jgi:hypothetical protein
MQLNTDGSAQFWPLEVASTRLVRGSFAKSTHVIRQKGLPTNWQATFAKTAPSVFAFTPTLDSVTPDAIEEDSGDTAITLAGTNFVARSVVRIDGTPVSTVFNSDTELEATVPAAMLTELDELSVAVVTSAPGGGTSNSLPLEVVEQVYPAPTLSTVDPDEIEEDEDTFVITVTGTGFVDGVSVVRWEGTDLDTTFVSSTELDAEVPDTLITTPGTFDITVFNHTPGGGESDAVEFEVTETAVTDPNFANVVTLLHMDGADASTTFTDVIGKTYTPVGDAQIDTDQSQFGGASGFFGTTGRITTPTHAGFGFGTGNYTIEFWMRPTNVSSVFRGIVDLRTGTSTVAPNINLANNTIVMREAESNRITSSGIISVDTWYHVAIARSGNDTKMFVSGTQVGSTYSTNNDLGSTQPCALGCFGAGVAVSADFKFQGHLDDVRITKGVARYTANFTPPAAPFPDA